MPANQQPRRRPSGLRAQGGGCHPARPPPALTMPDVMGCPQGSKIAMLEVAQQFRSPDRAAKANCRPVVLGSLMRTDQKPVPKCPGRRPGHFGTKLWSARIRRAAKINPEPSPWTGGIIKQPTLGFFIHGGHARVFNTFFF